MQVFHVYVRTREESQESLQGEGVRTTLSDRALPPSAREMSRVHWDLSSRWSLRRPRHPLDELVTCLLEHEVVVSGGPARVEVVARFVHALSDPRVRRGHVMRGGLVSLTIRKRRDAKRVDGRGRAKLVVRLKENPV